MEGDRSSVSDRDCEYCVGVPELFSLRWSRDPCVERVSGRIQCTSRDLAGKNCPVGVTCFNFPRGEFRLDFAHCNLRCTLCWAKQCPHEDHFNCYVDPYGSKGSYSPAEIVDRIVCRSEGTNREFRKKRTFQVRLTGGEPLLSRGRWKHIGRILSLLDDRLDPGGPHYSKTLDERLADYGPRGTPKRKRVVIQSNGVCLGSMVPMSEFMEEIESLNRIEVMFHLSIKGSSKGEFHLLTHSDGKLFDHQVRLVEELRRVKSRLANFHFHIVLGFFHSDKYVLWNPEEEKPMLMDPDPSLLRAVATHNGRVYAEALDFRSRMVKNARTIERGIKEGIVKKRDEVRSEDICAIEPLPKAGKKARIGKTFWKSAIEQTPSM